MEQVKRRSLLSSIASLPALLLGATAAAKKASGSSHAARVKRVEADLASGKITAESILNLSDAYRKARDDKNALRSELAKLANIAPKPSRRTRCNWPQSETA